MEIAYQFSDKRHLNGFIHGLTSFIDFLSNQRWNTTAEVISNRSEN